MNNSAAEVEELDEDLVRRAKEKVGELFNCHVNKLSQTIVAGHIMAVHAKYSAMNKPYPHKARKPCNRA